MNVIALIIVGWLAGCLTPKSEQTVISSSTLIWTPQFTATMDNTVIPGVMPSQTILPTLTAIPIDDPFGCLRPPDEYNRLQINCHWRSQRTLFMLQHAYDLYGGLIDVTDPAITQGHYNELEPLSFGTHSGGGVVDISVINRTIWKVLYEEIEPLILAIGRAGFAAWLRDFDELCPGSPIHIHAVAVGDRELSTVAMEHLSGRYGYFCGFNGLPQKSGNPVASANGELIICPWMLVLGYQDRRSE